MAVVMQTLFIRLQENPLVSLHYVTASRFCKAVLLPDEAVCILGDAAPLLGW